MGHLFRLKTLLFISFPLFSGCGTHLDLKIKGADLYIHEKNGIQRLEMESVFTLGSLKLPNIQSPIMIQSDKKIGEIDFQNLEDGTSKISISLNLKDVWKTESKFGKTLPNGRPLPISLAEKGAVIVIPILEYSRLYLIRFPNGSISSGVAINIPAFDSIFSQSAKSLKLFKVEQLSKEFSVVSGIYSSSEKGLNGLAIFSNRQIPSTINDRAPANTAFDIDSEEPETLDLLDLFRLNQLFQKNAVIKVK